jgi:hypothetical protein
MGRANKDSVKEYERVIIKASLIHKAGLLYLEYHSFFKQVYIVS